MFADARYNRVRRDHKVESHAVLIAKGVNKEGERDIIGVDVCNKENETNRSLFFNGLKNIGLKGVRLVISDAHPGLVKAIEENFPDEHRQRIRTTNSLERFNQEIKRRTSVLRIFPNRNSALRLIGALCMEQAEEWITGRQYLDMSLLERRKETKTINQPAQQNTGAGGETVIA